MESRILEELLPLQCDRCGYDFERTLAEYFDIGVRCPLCLSTIELDDVGIQTIADLLKCVHGVDDWLKDQRNVPPTLRNALRSGKPPT